MRIHGIILVGLLSSVGQAAFAQASSAPALLPEQAADQSVQDIVVTAQRREERLQDVPISITAVGTADLQRKGASQTTDLTSLVPGLNMGKSSTTPTPYLRGVGTANLTPGSDPSVPVYIDGVYISAPSSFFFSFNNIERLEVLKGPQGTLFGRNSTGGLIQIVTKDPQAGLSGRVSAGYSNYNTLQGSAYITGGSEKLSADLSLIYSNQKDGWGKNLYVAPAGGPAYPAGASREAGWLKEYGVRSKIKFTSDNTTAKLSLLYTQSEGNQGHYRHLLPGNGQQVAPATTPYFHGSQGEGFYDYNSDLPWYFKSETYLATGEILHDAGFVSVKSISSYLHAKSQYAVTSDASPQVAFFSTPFISYDTYTQELQVLSNKGEGPDWLQWIAGAYYLRSDIGYLQRRYTGQLLQQDQYSKMENESLAGYAQATISLPAEFQLTLGGRFTHDRYATEQYHLGRQVGGTNDNADGLVTSLVPKISASSNSTTWRVALDKHFTPDIMIYASANRGFKSGTWNSGSLCTTIAPTCSTVPPPVRPEKLLAFEVGLRSDFFDHRLRVNLSAFHYKYDDLQIQAVIGTPPESLLVNAANATVKGFEFDTRLKVTKNLTLTAAGSILDSKYSSFPGAIATIPRTVAPYGAAQIVIDAAGNQLSRAPGFSGNVAANWIIPTSIGEFELNASLYHTDHFYWEPQNRLVQPGYNLVNAQVAFRPTDALQVRVWAKNLGDKKYYFNEVTSSFGDQGAPGAPRTYGFAVDYSF